MEREWRESGERESERESGENGERERESRERERERESKIDRERQRERVRAYVTCVCVCAQFATFYSCFMYVCQCQIYSHGQIMMPMYKQNMCVCMRVTVCMHACVCAYVSACKHGPYRCARVLLAKSCKTAISKLLLKVS